MSEEVKEDEAICNDYKLIYEKMWNNNYLMMTRIIRSLFLIFFLANASAEGPLNFPNSKEFKVIWKKQGAVEMYVVKLGLKAQDTLILTKSPSADPVFQNQFMKTFLETFQETFPKEMKKQSALAKAKLKETKSKTFVIKGEEYNGKGIRFFIIYENPPEKVCQAVYFVSAGRSMWQGEFEGTEATMRLADQVIKGMKNKTK